MIAPRFQVTCAEPCKLNGVCDYEDDDSEDACEDVLGRSRAASAFYGVSWASFVEGSSRENRLQGFKTMKTFVTGEHTAKLYIGVTFCPVHRFFHEPGPHKLNYDVLHVLYLGVDVGRFEKNWLKILQLAFEVRLKILQLAFDQKCLSKCQNKGPGGERVRRHAVRYLYVCLKYNQPPTGGFQDDEVIEDICDDVKRRKLGPYDDQPLADFLS